MTAYQKEVMGSTVSHNSRSSSSFPLSVVHALYTFKEFFTPVARHSSDMLLYDTLLLCTLCKVYPIYRPCNRSSKKRFVDSYDRRCLQCYITKGISTRSGTIYEYVSTTSTVVECKCHASTSLLMFPAYVMFASASSLQLLFREQMLDILSSYYRTPAVNTYIRAGNSSSSLSSYQQQRRQHIDAQYVKSMIADSLADHFMLCTGPCAHMRMTLRMSGASSRTSQFLSMLTSLVGTSQVTHPPQPHYEDTAVTGRDEGEFYIQRLQFHINHLRSSYQQQHEQQQQQQQIYCPSCSCHIDTLLVNLPLICKLDSLHDISKRCGAYSLTHYDKFAPFTATAAAVSSRK